MSPTLLSRDYSLLVQRSVLAKARIKGGKGSRFKFQPNWPPLGWETDDVPRNDCRRAIQAWFAVMTHPKGPLATMAALGVQGKRFELEGSPYVRDAWRLMRHNTPAKALAMLPDHEEPSTYTPSAALAELAKISSFLRRKGAKIPKGTRIPPEKRTRPMSLKDAASLMGYTVRKNSDQEIIRIKSKKAAEKLRAAIDSGAVPCEKIGRQQFVFSRDSFPKETWRQLVPKA